MILLPMFKMPLSNMFPRTLLKNLLNNNLWYLQLSQLNKKMFLNLKLIEIRNTMMVLKIKDLLNNKEEKELTLLLVINKWMSQLIFLVIIMIILMKVREVSILVLFRLMTLRSQLTPKMAKEKHEKINFLQNLYFYGFLLAK